MLCAFTGAWGVLSGFAVFILWWREQVTHTSAFSFVLGLCAAVAASFVIESLRAIIEGTKPQERRVSRLSRAVSTIVMLGIFEIFILASHEAIGIFQSPQEILNLRSALLGPELQNAPGATRDLMVLAALWVLTGAALAVALSFAVYETDDVEPGWTRGLLIGGSAALLVAPFSVVVYIVGIRFVDAVTLAIRSPSEWTAHYETLLNSAQHSQAAQAGLPGAVYMFGLLAILVLTTLWQFGLWGKVGAAALLAVCVAMSKTRASWWPLIIVAVGFCAGVLAPFATDLAQVAAVPLLAAIVWFTPGAVLGLSVPLTEKPSERASLWAIVAALAAAVLILLTVLRKIHPFSVVAAVVLLIAALIFRRDRDVEPYWPALGLSVAALVTVCTLWLLHVTASFHTVLSDVSAINNLPASIATPGRSEIANLGDIVDRETHQHWFAAHLSDLDSLPYPQRRARLALVDQRAQTAAVANRMTIYALLRQKRAHLAENHEGPTFFGNLRLRPIDLKVMNSIADPNKLSDSELGRAAQREEDVLEAARRTQAYGELEYYSFWDDYELHIVLAGSALSDIARLRRDVATESAGANAAIANASQTSLAVEQWAPDAYMLELSIAGAVAFWLTIGLLASWSLRRDAAPVDDVEASH